MVSIDDRDHAEKQGGQDRGNDHADGAEVGVIAHERHGVQAALHAPLCVFLVEGLIQLAGNGHVFAAHEASQSPVSASVFPHFRAAVEIKPLVDHLPGHEQGAFKDGI
ncbi:hypothetical protein G6F57_021290 [Rhizopus arrhizus]|nr:hypothetical protein G6F31_018150 [Rhizopus arrhizus]KAG1435080.1 hypothetical protein G6F57_021290 [Rhizopus arrhizus]